MSGSPHQDTDTYGARQQDDKKRMPAETLCPEETPTKVLLLRRWSDMPRHLQFNPHILTGYRPLMTIRQCLGSLFYIHNETVNILTHGEARICTSLASTSFRIKMKTLNCLSFDVLS